MTDVELLRLLNECAHYLHYKKPIYRGKSRTLHCLEDEGAMTQRELMDRIDVKAGSMSELLQKMENDGLIKRKHDSSDRRRVIVSITGRGREQLAVYDRMREERAQDTFEILSSEEKEELSMIMTKLLDSWKSKWVVELSHDEQHKLLDKMP